MTRPGRVSAIGYQPSGGTTTPLLSQIAYQPFGGPVMSWSLRNGAIYGRAFDQDGRIVGLALPTNSIPASRAPFGEGPATPTS